MSAREDLARVIYEHGPRLLQGGNPTWDAAADMGLQRAPYEQADAVLTEWLPTLADDEALVEAVARNEVDRHYRAAAWNTLSLDAQARWLVDHRRNLLALAAALTPPP